MAKKINDFHIIIPYVAVRGLQSPHSPIKGIVSKVEYISELRLQEKYEASQVNATYPRRSPTPVSEWVVV